MKCPDAYYQMLTTDPAVQAYLAALQAEVDAALAGVTIAPLDQTHGPSPLAGMYAGWRAMRDIGKPIGEA